MVKPKREREINQALRDRVDALDQLLQKHLGKISILEKLPEDHHQRDQHEIELKALKDEIFGAIVSINSLKYHS